MKHIFITALLCSFVINVSAGDLANARKAKGKNVVKCSPEGNNGGLIPLKALGQVKRGTELILLPGNYDSSIKIDADRVIISGDGSGSKARVSIILNGKGCIIKNLWAHRITANRDTIIVDSIIDSFYSGYIDKGKTSHGIYNSGLGPINVEYRDTKVKLENCTVVSGYDALDCEQFSKWTINNCILYSNRAVFEFDGYGNKKCRLALRDNLIFGKGGLGVKNYTNSKSEISQASTFKDLKKMGNVTFLGKNIIEQPIFVKSVNDFGRRAVAVGAGRVITSSSSYEYLTPDHFRLAANSPGQGKGIVIAENFFFKKKKVTEKPAQELDPEEKVKKDNFDKEWEKIAAEARKKKKRKRKAEPNEEGELGGIPDQPK